MRKLKASSADFWRASNLRNKIQSNQIISSRQGDLVLAYCAAHQDQLPLRHRWCHNLRLWDNRWILCELVVTVREITSHETLLLRRLKESNSFNKKFHLRRWTNLKSRYQHNFWIKNRLLKSTNINCYRVQTTAWEKARYSSLKHSSLMMTNLIFLAKTTKKFQWALINNLTAEKILCWKSEEAQLSESVKKIKKLVLKNLLLNLMKRKSKLR